MFGKVFELQDLIDEANAGKDPQLAQKAKDAIQGARMLDEITPNEEAELLMELKVDYDNLYDEQGFDESEPSKSVTINVDVDDILDDLL